LPTPQAHSATDWPGVVRRMWLRMERLSPSYQVPVPTAAERVVISQYLETYALKVSAANLPAGAGRDLFIATCSQCHELPDPHQHSPDDWVTVARRMMTHMQDMLGASLTQDQLGQIAAYLRLASS
jgi:mono/diheme cytochrome c family protein